MCHRNSGRRGDRDQCRKQYLNKQWLQTSQILERDQFKDLRSSVNSRQDKLKTTSRRSIIKPLKAKDKERNLESCQRITKHYTQGTIIQTNADFSSESLEDKKTAELHV